MNRKRALFWVGLLVYTVSFFLFWGSCRQPGCGPSRGYLAAIYAVLLPLKENPFSAQWLFRDQRVFYAALLISGWINPFFIATVVLALLRRCQPALAILRATVLVMIPSCWVVFYLFNISPREGHFLWVLGMVLTLFSL
jgi:hypothetical protein